ncbi:hypothetical protein AB0D37_38695 [Streptomyces sp. NPDC048384]|uniref:hypothetical protein n=1 Tax=Streptomyces sp. NPDC048384 TaxID=3155487 RepID=UPI0034153443
MNTNSRTASTPSVLLPLLAGALCVLLGLALLRPGAADHSGRDAHLDQAEAQPVSPAPSAAAADTTPRPAYTSAPPASRMSVASTAPAPDVVPVPGDGPAGDYAVQQLLGRSSPADLPRAKEKELVALASRIWLAEVTGAGREKWPSYFGDELLRAPYRDVRIQAGIARSVNGEPDRVRVHLVWAGTDPASQAEDGRSAQILLTRQHTTWEPVR